MKIHEVQLHQEFNMPVVELWEAFNDHDSCGKIMGQKMVRVKDSTDPNNINGVHSTRKIHVPLLPFEETIRKSEKPHLIEYQISKDSPLAHHYGRMVFSSLPNGQSALDYTIEVGSNSSVFGWLIKKILEDQIGKALKKYAKKQEKSR